MSQNSSISSSDPASAGARNGKDRPGLYLLVGLSLTALALLALASFVFDIKFRNLYATQGRPLVLYQQERLAAAKGTLDTIFVGDSSLGNAISAKVFDSIAGTHSINLVLSGMFGYAGSFNMLRMALAEHPEIRNVIVMQTAGMMGRPLEWDGYVLSLPTLSLAEVPLRLLPQAIYTTTLLLLDWRPLFYTSYANKLQFANDYVKQGPSIRGTPLDAQEEVDPLNPKKSLFLHEIVRMCRERHLNCIYVQGPLRAGLIPLTRRNREAGNNAIRAAGITLALPEPLPIPEAGLGDSNDHVAPAFKPKSTAYYSAHIMPFLRSRMRAPGDR